ncbi:FUSC family protein [Streptomyces sp. NPDC005573]|uniref:FUSC family protein n=1 Tax=Streptomyces sp. NPDC005573 TaxID=3156890 RepID=UPI0033B2CD24
MSSAIHRRLPLAGALRLGPPSAIWFKPALSVVAATAPPDLLLLALGRLDLALYTTAGSLCALYAHSRPYAARARTLALVVLGMTGGLAAALLAASLTGDTVVLVTVGALLAAAQKAVCDATRIGPPGNVVLAFVSSASLFAPQTVGQVPGHVGLALAAGAWAWLVGMAPVLVRPYGPERRAVAQALAATAAYAVAHGAGEHQVRARTAATAAVCAARQALPGTPTRTDTVRRALERLLVRAEVALAAPAEADPERLRAWAGEARGAGRAGVADTGTGTSTAASTAAAAAAAAAADAGTGTGTGTGTGAGLVTATGTDVVAGIGAETVAGVGRQAGVDVGPVAARHRPRVRERFAAVIPVATRTALGCALAGYAALALGVGRPYWALVTAASLYQANVTLTWSRAVQRVVGNLLGVLVFAAVAPLAHLHPAALVLCCLAFSFGAEALIARNYWLGSVCVTPMALLITEFGHAQDPRRLIGERVADTVLGALVGFVAAVAVTNRRAGARVGPALAAAERAQAHAAHLMAGARTGPGSLEAARRALTVALADLRAAADTASGEWWQRPLSRERVALVEQRGHRTLAATARSRGTAPPAQGVSPPGGVPLWDTPTTTESAQA